MSKRFTRTEELIHAYKNTPATAKTLARQFGICQDTANLILKTNLDPALHEKLKAKKHQQNTLRDRAIKYRLEHGL